MILNQSPLLFHQFNEATRLGYLRGLAPLTNPNAGGTFHPDDKRIHVSLASLSTPKSGPFSSGEATFVLGHELQHAFNAEVQARHDGEFERAIHAVASSPAPVHDYTPVLAERLAGNRRDEASAAIAGWNAVVSASIAKTSEATLDEVVKMGGYRVADFFEERTDSPGTYLLKPNLHLNPDLSIEPTRANVEAMGKNFFDKSGDKTYLGFRGNSDYVNYYAAYNVGRIVAVENAHSRSLSDRATPRIAIDMDRLGLSEQILEENGLHLGDATRRMPYFDLSDAPPTRRHFDHTYESHEFRPLAPEGLDERARLGRGDVTSGPAAHQQLSPTQDIGAYLDLMLRAGTAGDDVTLRQMTHRLADLAAGRASIAQAKADVDEQEFLAAQQQGQERAQQMESQAAPPRRMHR
ncbi:hypothetical protein [Variovorax sp.]|uniref:hypothetical protein n=1 Tax=Variovorax sp. TaxID=1871043 RepID=UPI002D4B809E|nr:hypothetical protein [Variovorax sp.]HYP84122.1 hypothetical protein [Variovorax sp.]